MISSFGWFATDQRQRALMMEAVDQFRDKTTIDDLGLGVIRDAFSDTLFPGTSTLHTRIRYVLFLPWQMELAASKKTVEDMQAEMRLLEHGLIESLEGGGENQGVIGIEVRKTLSRPPSIVYWSALKSWGIIAENLTLRSFFERWNWNRELAKQSPKREDPEAALDLLDPGIDPGLPERPDDLMKSANFQLTSDEAQYLADQISRSHPTSLLAHLVNNRPETWISSEDAPAHAWDPEIKSATDPVLKRQLDLAERFSFHSLGANLLYNLLVAEKAKQEDRVSHYRQRLAEWEEECTSTARLTEDDYWSIWELVESQGRNLPWHTREFFSGWFDKAPKSMDVASDDELRKAVNAREFKVKGRRGRLHNAKALDAWSGASGDARLNFRWGYVAQHLQDIYDGRESA